MKKRIRMEKVRFHPTEPDAPAIRPLNQWFPPN